MQATQQLQTPCSSIAVAAEDELRAVAASNDGVVVMLDAEGNVQWRRELGCRTGAVSAAPKAALLAVPAYQEGAVLFDMEGTEVDRLPPEGGRTRRAELAADPVRLAVEADDASLRLRTREGSLLWEADLGGPWAIGDRGRLLVAARGSTVHAYRLPEAGAEGGKAEAARRPAEFLAVEEALAAGERAMASRRHKRPRVAWKKRLPAAGLPVQPELFRLTADGRHLAFVLQGPTLVVMDAGGEQLLRAGAGGPLRLAPDRPEQLLVAWSDREARALDVASGTEWTVRFSSRRLAALAAARECAFFCTLDEEGRLEAWSGGTEPEWQRRLKEEPRGLLVSPRGERTLVSDATGRFQCYDRRGRLTQKFRFDEEEQRPLAVGERFVVFGDPQGRLTVLDADGGQPFSRRLFEEIRGVEVLESTVAVYGQPGACALVNAAEGGVREFRPPPGQLKLRRPPGAGPLLVHADERTITVFSGYRRELSVVWRRDFGARIGAFDADRWARAIAVLAGEKLYWVHPHGS
jgi:hypothetical protein